MSQTKISGDRYYNRFYMITFKMTVAVAHPETEKRL